MVSHMPPVMGHREKIDWASTNGYVLSIHYHRKKQTFLLTGEAARKGCREQSFLTAYVVKTYRHGGASEGNDTTTKGRLMHFTSHFSSSLKHSASQPPSEYQLAHNKNQLNCKI